jgi:hypothetical protein
MRKLKMDHRAYQIFYKRLFSLVADLVIGRLGTCNGLFQLYQREICGMRKTRAPLRFHTFHTVENVMDVLQEFHPESLHFGAIFPMHYAPSFSLYPPPLDDATQVNRNDARPRYFDAQVRFKQDRTVATPLGEYIIDIDLDGDWETRGRQFAYDRTGVCGCGKEKKVCDICWATFMIPAQRVMQYVLRDFCGYQKVFFVFSGRRGMHIWVMDEHACCMTQEERKTLTNMIARPYAGDEMDTHIFREILQPAFEAHPVLVNRFVPSGNVHTYADEYRAAVYDALYPRLDEAVSTEATHLHKLPLTLHPETQLLCVVMDDADSPNRFVPSEDSIYAAQVEERHMIGCRKKIEKILLL